MMFKNVKIFFVLSVFIILAVANTNRQVPKGMVLVEGGTFMMGNVWNDKEADDDELPVYAVKLNSFYMDKTPVTVGDYKEYVKITGKKMPQTPPWGWIDSHPMVMVSWEEANDYALWAGKRLPTEAEWEYAARERGKEIRFAGTNDSTKLEQYAWFADKTVGTFDFRAREAGKGSTHPVATKKPNALGIYDLSGNVWEWTSNWYSKTNPSNDKSNPILNPKGPEKGLAHALKGGSWFSFAYGCRNSNRWFYGNRVPRNDDIGFRCVKDVN